MDVKKVDLIIQYALALASEADDFQDRELGPIHLVKFVYLADLAHAQQTGRTFTGVEWRFHHFGPWAVEVFKRIPEAASAIGAEGRRFPNKFKEEDAVRWRARDQNLLDKLDRLMTQPVASSLRGAVRAFGNDTKALLHHVYSTPPMLKAAPGEVLTFEASLKEASTLSNTEEALPVISKTKAKNLKALVKQRLASKRQGQRMVTPDPLPRYDEVFDKGQEWLDGIAGASMEPVSGRLHFSDSVWKSPARGEPDIP